MDIGGSVKAVGIVFAMMFASILAGSGFGIAGTQHAGIQAQVPVPPFRIGMLQPISSLNPFTALEDSDYTIFTLIYSTLTSWDQDWNPAPELAVSWRVLSWKAVDDPGTPQDEGANRLWQYDIRQGVTCTDGVPLTAADVAWNLNFNLATNPICWTNTPYIPLNIFDHAEVNTTLPNSVDLFLKVPSVLIDTMSIPIVPEHIFGSMSRQQVLRWDGLPPVGWGPFKFVEYVTGSHVTMVANDQYYAGKPHIETLQFFFYANDQVMAEALKKGDIDVATFPAAQTYNSLKGFPNIDTNEGSDTYAKDIGFNCYPDAPTTGQHPVNPLVRDERLHQALHYATNKQYLRDIIFGGYGDVGAGLVGQVYGRYYYDPGPDTFNFDLDKANETLEAAGYVWNGDVRVAGPGNPFASEGTPLEFEMLVINTAPEDVAMAPYLVGWWGIVGVKVTIVYVDEATMETRIYYKADHEIYLWYWSGIPDPRYILEVQTTSEIWGWSDNFWTNETYDELFLLQMQQTGEERNATVQEMCRINYLSSPFIFTVDADSMTAWRTDVWTGWGNVSTHVGYHYGSSYQPNPMLFGVMPIAESNMSPVFNTGLGSDYTSFPGDVVTLQVDVSDPESDQLTLNWIYGDSSPVEQNILSAGTTSTPQTVTRTHSYAAVGDYPVTVTLWDGVSGHEKQSTGTVHVQAIPDNPPRILNVPGYSPAPPQYTGTTVDWWVNVSDDNVNGLGLRVTWSWGDGSYDVTDYSNPTPGAPITDHKTHAWTAAAIYSVRMYVDDFVPDPAHNQTSATPYKIIQDAPPYALTVSPISGNEGSWIECVASGRDADPFNLRFTWAWDDGTVNVTDHINSLPGQPVTSTVSHNWSTSGTYPVTVYLDDLTGIAGHNISQTIDADISVAGANVAPSALVLTITPADPAQRLVGVDLTFNASAIDADADPMTVYIEFGDGSAAVDTTAGGVITRQYVDPEFTHAYAAAGTYDVNVWFDDGQTHNVTTTQAVTIVTPPANQEPWLEIQSAYGASRNVSVTITPLRCLDNDTDPLEVWYDWGDGTWSQGDAGAGYAGTHKYMVPDNYTLTVYANDGQGHNVSKSATVIVTDNLKPMLVSLTKAPAKTEYNETEQITFTVVVKDYEGDQVNLTVEFGDGEKAYSEFTPTANTNTTRTFTHTYGEGSGRIDVYRVNVTAKDNKTHYSMVWSTITTTVKVKVEVQPPEKKAFPWALVVGIAIPLIIVIAVVAFLLMKRKKKGGAEEKGAMEGMAPPEQPPTEPQ